MSRSPWAWTKRGYGHLARAVTSLSAPGWVATAVMLMLALSPAALGKVSSRTRATSTRPTTRASHTAGAAHPKFIGSPQTPRHAGGSRRTLLTLGSGYSTPKGSNAVRVLQRRLITVGFSPGRIDGRYGPLTQGAVVRFQAARGLQPDGIAGPHTMTALASAEPVLLPGDGYVRGGSRPVRRLQRELAAAGYSPGPADGRYGPLTRRAVLRFQHARHLATDGVAGPQTLRHLRTALARRRRHQPHRPASRTRGGGQRSRPAPARPQGAAITSRASAPRASGVRQSTGSLPIAWILALACVVIGVAAVTMRNRRRRRGRRSAPVTPPPEAGSEITQVRSDPWLPEDHDGGAALRLGQTLAKNGDRHGAEQAFRRAEERGNPAGAFELGVLLTLERYREAAAKPSGHPDRRRSCDPTVDIDALLLQEEDRATARDAFRRADERGHAGAACNLGVLLEEQGDVAGAIEAYRRADARGHAVGAYNLGTLLEQHGDAAGATDAYRRADERGDAMAAHRVGVLLERDGDLTGARDAYRRADQRGYSPGAHNPSVLLRQERDQQEPVERGETEAEREPDPAARPPGGWGSPAG